MRLGIYTLGLAVFIAVSCTDNEKDNLIFPDEPDRSRVNLFSPTPGQETMYLGYQQSCDSADFRWTGDTLVTQIVEEGGELYISEQFTPGSPSYQGAGSAVVYPISTKSGVVTLPQRQSSALFNFYGSDNIYLQPSDRIKLEQTGCLIATNDSIFIGDDIGRIGRFEIGEISIKDKTAVSCVPVIDIDAYLIYDKYQLYMSHKVSSSSFWGQPLGTDVWGWVMVE